MVGHNILVHGAGLDDLERRQPVILQMNDDDFPGRFLQNLALNGQAPASNITLVNDRSTLFQPVQRILHLALVKLNCNSVGRPRLDPTRVVSAGLVIRRVFRRPGVNGGPAVEDPDTLSGWMRSASGQFQWMVLSREQENWDPDPLQRPRLTSGQPELDARLTALSLAVANTESTTPGFAAPPATCAALNRTVFYAVIPTASSEVSDAAPAYPPQFDTGGLVNSLPAILLSNATGSPPSPPVPREIVDYRWMTDDYLNTVYPPASPGSADSVKAFRDFSTALRMLQSVFGAFDGTAEGDKILEILNRHKVYFAPIDKPPRGPEQIGDFYREAKNALLDYNPYPDTSSFPPTLEMPASWDPLDPNDPSDLVNALVAALIPRAQNLLAPQGRLQDNTRWYRLRLFFRVKSETPGCPPQLVWSHYSEPFQIASWFTSGQRAHPPIQLPDLGLSFLSQAKPNCAFHVPGNLMAAIQGTSLSGLMNGGGGGLSLGWICGFNIPLITICAFFVLNIFLSLLNIIFFWLPFIKICIPFPNVSSSSPDKGSP